VLDEGRLTQFEKPELIYATPASPGVARLLNCYNLFDGTLRGESFASGYGRFPANGQKIRSEQPSYAIRQDRIDIRPHRATASDGEGVLDATFIASEYTGAAMMYFFSLPDSRIIEVEQHLSHHAPRELVPQQAYRLAWKGEHSIVYS
jgi:ABC-type Fe3+/spermidine/putrescine transport system ATPase subunit